METVIAQGIQLLLPYQNIQRIAFEILWNYHQNTTRVDNLQVLSLKTIMKKKKKKSDRPAKVFYRVLFKEYQNLEKFTDRFIFQEKWKKISEKILYSIHDFFTGYQKIHKIYQKLRTNPHLMLAILQLDQGLENNPWSHLYIIITKNCLEIKLYDSSLVAEIPHRNGIEYDTHWASGFARMAFSKNVPRILLKVRGDKDTDLEFLHHHLTNWLNSFKPTIPEEGWERAIESGKQLIYAKYTPWMDAVDMFYQSFEIHKSFSPDADYWGYLA